MQIISSTHTHGTHVKMYGHEPNKTENLKTKKKITRNTRHVAKLQNIQKQPEEIEQSVYANEEYHCIKSM